MDILKSNIIVGVGAALAVTVLAPVLAPAVAIVGRPLAKSLLKSGLMLYEKSREAVAMAGETMEDLVAEIRAEEAMRAAAAEQAPAAAGAAPAPASAAAGAAPASAPASTAPTSGSASATPAPGAGGTAEPLRPDANGGATFAGGGAGARAQAGIAAV